MAVATGVIHLACRPARGTGFEMATERLRPTGDNGSPDAGLGDWQGMGREIGWTMVAQYLRQAHTLGHPPLRWAAGRATPAVRLCRSIGFAPDGSNAWSYPRGHGRADAEWYGCRHRLRADGWRNCASRCHHTAHHLGLARVCYRHHPFCGYEVEVVRSI